MTKGFMLKLWNSLTRTREAFGSINPQEVRMYTCGPTVYDRASIGNFRSYVTWDLLKRVLQADGYKVVHAMNITDVGHLVGDGDEGEDKLQKSAQAKGKTAWEIAKEYEALFIKDSHDLNIVLPEPPLLCRATEHIPEQIKLIQILEEQGFIYVVSDGVYFDTSRFPAYGRLSGQPLEEKMEGARVSANSEKKHPTDFALWKFSYPGGRSFDLAQDSAAAKRHMEWESPWGVGFPGWHIECSAMSRKYLGQPFDIHGGGVDHIPVHHENEIAQSVAAYNVTLANFWVHNEFLTIDGQKMSKSLGNIYTLDDCRAKGIEPLALRYFYFGAHYRSKLNFTWQAAEASQIALNKLREAARSWEPPTEVDLEADAAFMAEMHDDLNTPAALAVLWDTVKSDLDADRKAATLLAWDRMLGLGLDQYIAKPVEIPEQAKAVAQRRWEARSRQDWEQADQLRHELEDLGWKMEDGTTDFRLKPKI
jgi:cysteinyl-tRNA synthetase